MDGLFKLNIIKESAAEESLDQHDPNELWNLLLFWWSVSEDLSFDFLIVWQTILPQEKPRADATRTYKGRSYYRNKTTFFFFKVILT